MFYYLDFSRLFLRYRRTTVPCGAQFYDDNFNIFF